MSTWLLLFTFFGGSFSTMSSMGTYPSESACLSAIVDIRASVKYYDAKEAECIELTGAPTIYKEAYLLNVGDIISINRTKGLHTVTSVENNKGVIKVNNDFEFKALEKVITREQ